MPSRSKRGLIRRLATRKGREAEGLFLAEGVRVVEDLLESRIVPRLALVAPSLEDTTRGLALLERLSARVEVERVQDHELERLAPTESPQGVLVLAELPAWRLDELADGAAGGAPVFLVLDSVQDPGNVGTLLRTADALGVAGCVLLPGTVDPWNAKAVRASAGSVFRVRTALAALPELGAWLDARAVPMLAADAAGAPVRAADAGGAVALVVGNEGAGVGRDVLERCAGTVAVPIRGGAESLNVAVAAGILLYELTSRRAEV